MNGLHPTKIILRKDEYIVTLLHEDVAEGGYGPHHSIHDWKIGIGEKGDVQVYSVGLCNKERSLWFSCFLLSKMRQA
jgi:hypothetical protein